MSHACALHSTDHPIRAFVVDDAPKVVAALSLLLARQPGLAVVGAAGNGHDALAGIARVAPDLVVMDVHLPGLDGLEAAAALRARHPQVRIILISIDQDTRLQADCRRHGADSFLPKIGLQRRLLEEIGRLFPHAMAPGFHP